MFFEKHEQAASRFTLVGRVRRVYPEDMREILSFGHEAWGKDKSLDEFLEAAQANSDTRRGEWYLFENPEGVSCSGLNTLRFQRGLVGFASLATKQEERGKGYALLLMRAAMELLSCEAPNGRFLLYSEIAPTAYERLGFRVLPEELQYFKPAVAMATGDTELTPEERQFLRRYF
jgi:GNAT superfamily N-acetyltransferase